MIRKYVIPLLALFGLFMGIRTVFSGSKAPPPAAPVVEPPRVPFERFVAGSGIIEASTENIAVASQVPGVVTEIFVKQGDEIKAGAPLFAIDSREIRARVEVQRANIEVAKREAEDAKEQFALYQSIGDRRAVSAEEYTKRKNAVAIYTEKLRLAEVTLQLSLTDLEILTTKAPVDGEVLQVKVRLGEYAPAAALSTPLLVLGNTRPLHVRVDIDENDAWRVKKGAPGIAFLRGNSKLSAPLEFVRFEPYVIPKRSLTGESSERVDTRVLQVLYAFDKRDLPVFVGQLMDVFVES